MNVTSVSVIGNNGADHKRPAEVVQLQSSRKRRGRPPLDRTKTKIYTEDQFDIIAAGVAGISDRHWPRVVRSVELTASTDKRLNATDRALLTYLMSVINRKKGFDWHGINAIADALKRSEREIMRAMQRLDGYGYVLRRIVPVSGHRTKVHRRGETTLPILVEVAQKIRVDGSDGGDKKSGSIVTRNSPDSAEKIHFGGDKNNTHNNRKRIQEKNAHQELCELVQVFDELVQKGQGHVVKNLLIPLREALPIRANLSCGHARALGEKLAGFSADVLSAVADEMISTRSSWPTVAQALECAKRLAREKASLSEAELNHLLPDLEQDNDGPMPAETLAIRKSISSQRDGASARLWFGKVHCEAFKDGTLFLRAPNEFVAYQIERDFCENLEIAARAIFPEYSGWKWIHDRKKG